VADFLAMEEVKPHEVKLEPGVAMRITDGTFHWGDPNYVEPPPKLTKKESKKGASKQLLAAKSSSKKIKSGAPVLANVNLVVREKELVAIVGSVAAGKSSLCNALLGELWSVQGSVEVQAAVAYAAQTPWVLNATLRDNILFGEPYDERKYSKVLDACQLTHDLHMLQDGDQTMIGERGTLPSLCSTCPLRIVQNLLNLRDALDLSAFNDFESAVSVVLYVAHCILPLNMPTLQTHRHQSFGWSETACEHRKGCVLEAPLGALGRPPLRTRPRGNLSISFSTVYCVLRSSALF
jgi:energy-coupling factor transporter ATP-binding protein EcfA2